jgi:Sec-independent protein translocase protein TatA
MMSFWELMVILLVALIVIKPERLPEVCYHLGQWFARLKRWQQQLLEKFTPWT